jgi:hypothetical protein
VPIRRREWHDLSVRAAFIRTRVRRGTDQGARPVALLFAGQGGSVRPSVDDDALVLTFECLDHGSWDTATIANGIAVLSRPGAYLGEVPLSVCESPVRRVALPARTFRAAEILGPSACSTAGACLVAPC